MTAELAANKNLREGSVMRWWSYLNIALLTLVIGQIVSLSSVVQAWCYDPCNDVFWCTKQNPCPEPEPGQIVICEVKIDSGPFACCCSFSNGCCQYTCYGGTCLLTGNRITLAINGQPRGGAICRDSHCHFIV